MFCLNGGVAYILSLLYSPVSNTVSEIPHEQLQLVHQCKDTIGRRDSHVVQTILPRLHKHNDILVSSYSITISSSTTVTYPPTYLVHHAARFGCTDVTKELTSIYNCDPTRKDCYGFTALHMAAGEGHLAIVQHLISNCGCAVSDRSNRGHTPLHCAVPDEHSALGAAPDENVYLAIIQYLVQCSGTDVAIATTKDNSGCTPLHYAAQYGRLAIVQYLVQCSGTDVAIATTKDNSGCTPLHYAAQYGRLAIVQYLVQCSGTDVAIATTKDNSGCTPLHYAARDGHLAIVQYLHDLVQCSGTDVAIATTKDNSGCTPLHYAAQWGYLAIVQYLVQCSGTDVAIATDEDGATPLHHACQYMYNEGISNIPVIKYLLSIPVVLNFFDNKDSNSTLFDDTETAAIFNKYENIQISHPVGSFVNIFLLGDTGAGKTSLCQVLKERSELHIKDGELVQGVKTHTAGIVPSLLREDKSLGNVIVHDFAGQPEYYSSHTAVLESLLQSSGAVFVVLINLTQDLLQQIGRWSSIVLNETQKVSSECHLIVIASHADQVKQELQHKLLDLKGHVLRQFTVAGRSDASLQVFPLDCRLRASHTLHSFVESLSQSCRSIRNKQSPAISLYCNFLYSILEAKVSEDNVCTLEKLKSLCDQSRQEDVPLPDDIVPLLKTLHSSGLIVYLENEEDLEKSWIVVRKEILLAEVDGILFAPSGFKEHRGIFSNTGIITSSVLKEQFPRYSSNMLIAFLQSMKLCEALNTSLLEVTNLTLRQKDSLQVSDQLLFFPALIAEERPQDIKGRFKSGWCLKVVSRFSFSVRFLHILLLRLAYEYSVAVSSRDRPWVVEGSERRCSVWINGIHWYDGDGVEAMVEQTEGGQCVTVLMSCEEGAEEEMVKLHLN